MPEATAAADAGKMPTTPDEKKQEEVDDAVLKMAMAMAEEDDGAPRVTALPEKKQEEGFDFNIIVTAFWSFLIIYSFGSSIIGIATGRIQDRTGGDFTAYDFFDNIFSFKEWSLEYTLGFDPFKLFNQVVNGAKSGGGDLP